jgi:hypothetical protein
MICQSHEHATQLLAELNTIGSINSMLAHQYLYGDSQELYHLVLSHIVFASNSQTPKGIETTLRSAQITNFEPMMLLSDEQEDQSNSLRSDSPIRILSG